MSGAAAGSRPKKSLPSIVSARNGGVTRTPMAQFRYQEMFPLGAGDTPMPTSLSNLARVSDRTPALQQAVLEHASLMWWIAHTRGYQGATGLDGLELNVGYWLKLLKKSPGSDFLKH